MTATAVEELAVREASALGVAADSTATEPRGRALAAASVLALIGVTQLAWLAGIAYALHRLFA